MNLTPVQVINELGFQRQVKAVTMPPMNPEIAIYDHNDGVIKVTGSFRSRRTRHIDIKHHEVRGNR